RSYKIIRGADLRAHDRLQQNGGRLLHRLLESHRASNFKGHFRGVHVMIRAVVEGHSHVYHGKPGDNTFVHRFHHALLNGGDKVSWNRPPHNVVDEFKTCSSTQWFDFNPRVALLAMP